MNKLSNPVEDSCWHLLGLLYRLDVLDELPEDEDGYYVMRDLTDRLMTYDPRIRKSRNLCDAESKREMAHNRINHATDSRDGDCFLDASQVKSTPP